MKSWLGIVVFAIAVAIAPQLALADAAKPAPSPPGKQGSESRLFVIEKDAPSLDKTVKLARAALPVTKNK